MKAAVSLAALRVVVWVAKVKKEVVQEAAIEVARTAGGWVVEGSGEVLGRAPA